MILEEQLQWVCPACRAENVSTIWPAVDAGVSPELALRVQDGSLFANKCSRCSRSGRLSYPMHYHDTTNQRYCMYRSAHERRKKHDRQFMDSVAAEYRPEYELRCVYDLASLIELACIWRDDLDDMTMLCVRLMLTGQVEQEQGKWTSSVRYLRQVEGEEGMGQEFLVVYADQPHSCTMRTPDSLYRTLLPRTQQSKPSLFPAGRWIDWTVLIASQVVKQM